MAIEETLVAPAPKDEVVLEPVTDIDQTPEEPKADKPTEEEPKDIKLEEEAELEVETQAELQAQLQEHIEEAEAAAPKPEAEEGAAVAETVEEAKPEEGEEVSDAAYQVAAVNLVNDILEKLDVESLEDE